MKIIRTIILVLGGAVLITAFMVSPLYDWTFGLVEWPLFKPEAWKVFWSVIIAMAAAKPLLK